MTSDHPPPGHGYSSTALQP